MEHILYVTHIKINKTQLYLTIQLPKPDLKLRAELYYQNSSQDFHHPLRCISRTSQKLIFQMDVSVLENGENDWDLLIRSDKTSESWTVILGARLRTQLILGNYCISQNGCLFSLWEAQDIVSSFEAVLCAPVTARVFILKNFWLSGLANC